jgi:hypothetical protein
MDGLQSEMGGATWLGILVLRLRFLRHTAHRGQDRDWRGINTLDCRAAKCRYQHPEPLLATQLDALTQQPRSLTLETVQRYFSALHCALVLGYNRVSPESCEPQARPWFVRAYRYEVNCCFFAPRMTVVGIPSFRSRVALPTPCLLP